MNIYEKLQKARVDLQNLKLKKSGTNKFAGFNYFELSDFLPAVNEIFDKHKICSAFNLDSEKATLAIINSENPEELLVFDTPIADASIKGCTPIQSLGGQHTYLKRYLYLNALEIVEGDLLDGVVGKDEKKTTKQEEKKEVLNPDLLTQCKALGIKLENLATYYKKDLKELTNEDLTSAIKTKEAALKAKGDKK